MTVVEFFTNSPLENMISCFSLKPDKVIFLGDGRRMHRLVSAYQQVAKRLGINAVFEVITVPHNSINKMEQKLTEIINTEEHCCFDLTGGDDLALVAMGIVFQKYKDTKDIQMQRFNIKTGRLIDCDNEFEKTAVYANTSLNSKEYISLYGGRITECVTYRSEFDDDISKLWSICKTKPVAWNKIINILGQSTAACVFEESGRRAVINKNRCYALFGNSFKFDEIRGFITQLSLKGLVKNIEETNEAYSFTYSSPVVKKCLTKAGDVLELFVLSVLSRQTNTDGTPYFSDVISGVVIDWDGVYSSSASLNGTINEIDVMAMKGVIPTFISCKNGGVDESELYKLSAVADRFGGVYSKKVLILSNLNKKGAARDYFLQRAKDMGIRVIDNMRGITEKDLADVLKNL